MTTETTLAFRRKFEDSAAFLATCDGGDPGSPDQPSIWLLGLEPGWSGADEEGLGEPDKAEEERFAQYPIELQMEWPFNRNAFKLLSALAGGLPDQFRSFAEQAQPFVRGSKGYLKGNLFPVPFNNVSAWDEHAVEETGFTTKEEYRTWARNSRFPILKEWIERSRPKLVIGCGLTHAHDFLEITGNQGEPDVRYFEVNGHSKRIVLASGQVPLVVVPHLTGGPHSLNSYEAIKVAAEIIRTEFGL